MCMTQVRIPDKGSHPQLVRVVVAGVPVEGVVDTAADITIVGAEVFKYIAAVARMKSSSTSPWPITVLHGGPTLQAAMH